MEREDLFTANIRSQEKTPVRLVRRGETSPNNGSSNMKPIAEVGADDDPHPPEGSTLVDTENKDIDSSILQSPEFSQNGQRIHYSESTTDVEVPRHIMQLTFEDKSKFNESQIRSFAASRLNAELRSDNSSILLIFQSCNAAAKALESSPFKEQFNASLEHWTPRFFPTSMF